MTYRKLISASFVLNGLTMICTQAVGKLHLTAHIPMVLFFVYSVGGVMALVHMAWVGKPIEGKSIVIGALGGIGTAVGLSASMAAASVLPGYIVFPIISGGTLLIVALIGRIVFKERIGPYGIAGIVAGACAIGLLSA